MSSSDPQDTFPVDGVLPKRQTQALQFVEQNPAFDGRDVIVAILDTGVDPGAKGLQVTSSGKPKVIDIQDSSGSGDVDVSTIRKGVEPGGEITGLTGKTLKLGKGGKWTNPSKEWHVGVKVAYQFFPTGLISRMKAQRKDLFLVEHRKAIAFATQELNRFDAENKCTSAGSKLPADKLLARKELQAKLKLLEDEEKNFKDPGPVFDCVTFCDEQGVWRAVVDKLGDGNLADALPMTTFKDELQFDQWDASTQLNYCFNIHDNGNILSIVVDSGAHGTHVASIVASNFPDTPELNGVAPGAQIVSYKIGDGRIGGMETGTAIIRALNACVAAGVDVINMSFGEPTKIPDGGRVADLCRELVYKHGIVFVSSAGNAGPALSTVGAPGSTSTPAMIGVGAYVDPRMMLAEYSLRREVVVPAINYTWSSRGPTYDGQLGVCISAPGGAIASVPNWTLQQKQLMNGTSMASPNAAGGIALILSGLKSLNCWYSPHRIRRALEATAKQVPGVERHALGHGLIQVADAFEAAKFGMTPRATSPPDTEEFLLLDLPFDVKVINTKATTGCGNARGIYLRDPHQVTAPQEFTVMVTPLFETDLDDPTVGTSDRVRKLDKSVRNTVDAQLQLVSTEPWIVAPSHLYLGAKGRSFKLEVDPTALPCGQPGNNVPYGEVLGFDPRFPRSVGPLFRVPVTVIRPEVPFGKNDAMVDPSASLGRLRVDPTAKYANVEFTPGKIVRHFIAVPHGATTATVSLRASLGSMYANNGGAATTSASSSVKARHFFIHCLQTREHSCYRDDQINNMVELKQEANSTVSRDLPVVGGRTVEVCIAQYWSSPGSGAIDIEVSFSGVVPAPSQVTLTPSNGLVQRIDLYSQLCPIRVYPSGVLDTWSQTINPKLDKAKLDPLPLESRDAVLGCSPPAARPTYQLVLHYEFEQPESCANKKLRLYAPLLNELLYDSPLDAQMAILYDANKKQIACSDAWPDFVACPAGKMTAKLCIRHESKQLLETFKNMHLVVQRKLATTGKLTFFSSSAGPVDSANNKFGSRYIGRGQTTPVFVSAKGLNIASLCKDIKAGDVLSGTVKYAKRDPKNTPNGVDERKGGYPIEMVVPPLPATTPKAPSLETPEKGKEKTDQAEDHDADAKANWTEALAKSKISMLKDIKVIPELDAFFASQVADLQDLVASLPEKKREESTLLDDLRAAQLVRWCTSAGNAAKDVEKQSNDDRASLVKALLRLEEFCDQVCKSIDAAQLSNDMHSNKVRSSVADKIDQLGAPESVTEESKRLKTRKSLLVDAVVAKTAILLWCLLNGVVYGTDCAARMESAFSAMVEAVNDAKSLEYLYLSHLRSVHQGRIAVGLTQLLSIPSKKLADASTTSSLCKFGSMFSVSEKGVAERSVLLAGKLELGHLAGQYELLKLANFPADYPMF